MASKLVDALQKHNLLVRLLTSIVMGVLVVGCIYQGKPLFEGMVFFACTLMAYEWIGLSHPRSTQSQRILYLFSLWLVFMTLIVFGSNMLSFIMLVLVSILWLLLPRAVVGPHPGVTASGYAAIVVPAVSLLHIYFQQPWGHLVVLWLFGVVWITDIAAFFCGRSIGGPRLLPHISPNKTWSGFLGGLFFGTLFGSLFPLALQLPFSWTATAAALVISLASHIGDLSESALKRYLGARDSGKIIPGHGGILDRVDGLMLAAPVLVIWLWWVKDNVF